MGGRNGDGREMLSTDRSAAAMTAWRTGTVEILVDGTTATKWPIVQPLMSMQPPSQQAQGGAGSELSPWHGISETSATGAVALALAAAACGADATATPWTSNASPRTALRKVRSGFIS